MSTLFSERIRSALADLSTGSNTPFNKLWLLLATIMGTQNGALPFFLPCLEQLGWGMENVSIFPTESRQG
jgi:hypothetical protein